MYISKIKNLICVKAIMILLPVAQFSSVVSQFYCYFCTMSYACSWHCHTLPTICILCTLLLLLSHVTSLNCSSIGTGWIREHLDILIIFFNVTTTVEIILAPLWAVTNFTRKLWRNYNHLSIIFIYYYHQYHDGMSIFYVIILNHHWQDAFDFLAPDSLRIIYRRWCLASGMSLRLINPTEYKITLYKHIHLLSTWSPLKRRKLENSHKLLANCDSTLLHIDTNTMCF